MFYGKSKNEKESCKKKWRRCYPKKNGCQNSLKNLRSLEMALHIKKRCVMAKPNSLLCDTNVLVYFIAGNIKAGKIFKDYQIILSSITYIEILSNKKLTSERMELLLDFLKTFTFIETSPSINKLTINMRLNYRLNTQDAIIAATAKYLDLSIVTNDTAFFKIKEIEIIPFTK